MPAFPNMNLEPVRNPVVDSNRILMDLQKEMLRSTVASQRAAVASLAGGIIAASGRPHSVQEAMAVMADLHHSMYPDPRYGGYLKWKEELGDRLEQPHT